MNLIGLLEKNDTERRKAFYGNRYPTRLYFVRVFAEEHIELKNLNEILLRSKTIALVISLSGVDYRLMSQLSNRNMKKIIKIC